MHTWTHYTNYKYVYDNLCRVHCTLFIWYWMALNVTPEKLLKLGTNQRWVHYDPREGNISLVSQEMTGIHAFFNDKNNNISNPFYFQILKKKNLKNIYAMGVIIQWNLVITRSLGPWKLPCYIRFLIISGYKNKDI